MAVTDQTRKHLWAKSGNCCAICKASLVHDPTGGDGDYVIGQECHICSSAPAGPRHDPNLSPSQLDDYANLTLLCRGCHKVVDEAPDLWPPQRLRQQKEDHQRWVTDSLRLRISDLDPEAPQSTGTTVAIRLTTGAQVLNLLASSQARDFGHDELSGEAETELVASFLQSAEDWSEIGDQVGAGDAVHIAQDLSLQLRELEEHGLWVFGCTYAAQFREPKLGFRVAYVRVVRTDNPAIVALQASPPDA